MSNKFFITAFLVIFCGIFLTSTSNAISSNLALNKSTKSFTFYTHFSIRCVSDLIVDGDVNPDLELGSCFHSADGAGGPNWALVDLAEKNLVDFVNLYSRNCNPERLDYFIIGLTSFDYFAPGSDIIRGTYPLCGQYKYKAVISSKHTQKCNANLVSYRYVFAQQPTNGPGSFAICEMEVYAADNPNAKMWTRYMNNKLTGYTTHEMTTSPIGKCLFSCSPGLCHSVNFKKDGSICQLNQHLFGYSQTDLNINADGWSFYEAYYA